MRRARFAAVVFMSIAAAYIAFAGISPHAAGGQLLTPLPRDAVRTSRPVQAEAAIARSRYTTINFDILRGRDQRQMLREPSLTLELFPDVTVFAVFDRYDRNADGVTWVGHVDGMSMSTVTLVYGNGLMAGSVIMPNGAFRIRPASGEVRAANRRLSGELHLVEQVDQSALTPEAPPIEVHLSQAEKIAAADTPMNDAGDVIDLLVLYTALAATHAGGQGGISNLINLAVSETNTSYANSGVNHRIRLVGATEVPYVESGNFSTNLNNVRSGLGTLSGVPALRDAVGADMVTLLVHPTAPSACGVAFLMTSINAAFAPSAYSVTDTACVSPGYTFAHELGHNMGARHDWYMDGGTTPFTYAHGHVNAGQRWRTVMAYPDMCLALGFSCTRLLFWANPERRFLPSCDSGRVNCAGLQYWFFPGVPMGVAGGTSTACTPGNALNTNCDADDRRTLNQTAFTIANFRQAVVPDGSSSVRSTASSAR